MDIVSPQVLDSLAKLSQVGAAILIMVAMFAFLKFLREEREDRKGERKSWFDRMAELTDSIKTALKELQESRSLTCPITKLNAEDVEAIVLQARIHDTHRVTHE